MIKGTHRNISPFSRKSFPKIDWIKCSNNNLEEFIKFRMIFQHSEGWNHFAKFRPTLRATKPGCHFATGCENFSNNSNEQVLISWKTQKVLIYCESNNTGRKYIEVRFLYLNIEFMQKWRSPAFQLATATLDIFQALHRRRTH